MARSKKQGVWSIGQCYFIRTVTHYLIGIIEAVDEHEIRLRDAAWIADTGRFSEALKTGKLNEVEPCPDGEWIVGRGSIVDAGPWPHGTQRVTL